MKNVVVFMGYGPEFHGDNWREAKNIGGSEIAVANVLEYIHRLHPNEYKFHLFGHTFGSYTDSFGNEWKNAAVYMSDFMRDEEVDVLVIWRYVNCIVTTPFLHRAKKVILWLHDVIFHPALQGDHITHQAGPLIVNFASHLHHITYQTEWHRMTLMGIYPYPILKDKFVEMPNGVDGQFIDAVNTTIVPKIKNRFIWASHHDRNIENLLRMWPLILQRIPDATLVVCGDSTPNIKGILDEAIKNHPSIEHKGKLGHTELFDELRKAEVFFYPTFFPETYCMLALEAQLAGCFCIVYGTAGLRNTVGDRGVILDVDQTRTPPDEDIVNAVVHSLRNRDVYVDKCVRWAKEQGWENRAKMWVELFEK